MKLITYAYLRKETNISQNIPDSELEHPIERAQETLKMLICLEFYNEIETQQCANIDTLNIYIKKFLAWQSYQYWIIHANFKTTASGIRVYTEDNSVVVNEAQMATLMRDAKEQVQFYKEHLVKYLDNNRDFYPLYCGACTNSNTGNGFGITSIGSKRKHCGH